MIGPLVVHSTPLGDLAWAVVLGLTLFFLGLEYLHGRRAEARPGCPQDDEEE